MPIFKATWFFIAGSNGWTESFYFNKENYPQVAVAARIVSDQRVKLLGSNAKIDVIRTSDIAVRGDAEFVAGFTQVPSSGVNAGPRDAPWNTWVCRMQASPLYRRAFHVRGLVDAWIVIDAATGFATPTVVFQQRIASFLQALILTGASLKVVSKAAADVGDWDINAMAFAGGKLTVTAPGHTLAVRDSVRITKGRYAGGADVVKGVYKVTAVAVNTFEVVKDLAGGPVPVYLGEATAQRRRTVFAAIDELLIERLAWRKTGRVFFVARGSQPKRQ
jgi:hypothetical protein